MLAWMIYALSVSMVLSLAALFAEQFARHRQRASRWCWLGSIVGSILIPTMVTSVALDIPSEKGDSMSPKVIALHEITSTRLSPAIWVEDRESGSAIFQNIQTYAKSAWLGMSGLMLVSLLASALHLERRKRSWSTGVVCGVTAYFSPNVGPAVVGLIRPRIVVPIWLLDSPPDQQAAAIAHESSHVDAHDPAVLTIALCLVAFMPWNLPLWWQLRRLRYAIEVDCDVRVLQAGHKLSVYGETLIAVGERQSRYIGSVAGMSESKSFLERRLRLMLRKPAKNKLLVAVLFGCASITLVTLAAQVSPPTMNDVSHEHTQVSVAPEVLERYVGAYQASDTTVLTFRREGDHLVSRRTGQGWLAKYPMSDTKFFAKVVELTDTFVVDDAGRVTALVHLQNGREETYPRIDSSTAEAIEAKLAAKIKSQLANPASEAALRRLIDGTMSGNPNYPEMSSMLQDATREQLPRLREGLNRAGPVESVKFVGVGNQGWDIYQVTHESGASIWRIHLTDSGIIDGALLSMGP